VPLRTAGRHCHLLEEQASVRLMVRLRDTEQGNVEGYAGCDERLNPQLTKAGWVDFQICHEAVDNFQPQRTFQFFVRELLAEFLAGFLQLFQFGP